MSSRLLAVLWYGLTALGGVAAAQPSTITYHSAYSDYNPYDEEPIVAWRQLNDEAARVGGHAGIFRAATKGANHDGRPRPPSSETTQADQRPSSGAHTTKH